MVCSILLEGVNTKYPAHTGSFIRFLMSLYIYTECAASQGSVTMNISADGILGTAQKINQKRQSAKSNQQSSAPKGKQDSVQIQTQLSGRLNNLQQDLRSTQDSLSAHQVVRDGLQRLMADVQAGGNGVDQIIDDVRYNDKPVLADFLGGQTVTEETLTQRMDENNKLISADLNQLSRLQVETENIFASNLIPDTSNLSQNISESNQSPDSISNLNADTVMRLTRQ